MGRSLKRSVRWRERWSRKHYIVRPRGDTSVISEQTTGVQCFKPFDAHCCHMCTAIKHPVPDRVKPSFVTTATVGVKGLTKSTCRDDTRLACLSALGHTVMVFGSRKNFIPLSNRSSVLRYALLYCSLSVVLCRKISPVNARRLFTSNGKKVIYQ